jgi:hypothetical protein
MQRCDLLLCFSHVRKGNSNDVSLTRLEPGDPEPLRRFWSRLSPETRYRRFMIPLAMLEAERLLDVDHRDREAIVAVVEGEIVGVVGARAVELTDANWKRSIGQGLPARSVTGSSHSAVLSSSGENSYPDWR